MFETNILSTIIVLPLLGILSIAFIPNKNETLIKQVAIGFASITFLISTLLWIGFDNSTEQFQFVEKYDWIPFANITFTLGVDGISLFFVLLTTLLIPVCMVSSWDSVKIRVREYMIVFLLMDAMLITVFSVLDLLLFYIFFESVLIPMFLVIGIWGARERKIHAAYQFFLYTLFGSVFMLVAILYIYFEVGTTDIPTLLTVSFPFETQKLLWLAFFASFAIKVPMMPVHIWLPEAHVEAPTAGSVILAGVLLKLGTYGLIRFSLPLFPEASVYFTPLVYTMSVVAIIYASLTTIRQIDIKKVIAYSSVAHMNFVTIGLFALNAQGLEGSMLLMLGHGFVSSALFLCVGIMYDRHHTRIIKYYGGITQVMPIYSSILLFFTLANISLPGTSNFVGEFLILAGAFKSNTTITVLASTGIVLGAVYAMWLYNRIAFGTCKVEYIKEFADINSRELTVLLPFIFLTLLMGIYPEVFLDPMHVSIENIIEQVNFPKN